MVCKVCWISVDVCVEDKMQNHVLVARIFNITVTSNQH